MPRGIPWDSLPSPYERKHHDLPSLGQLESVEDSQGSTLPAFDFEKHPVEILRRVAFGVVVSDVASQSQ